MGLYRWPMTSACPSVLQTDRDIRMAAYTQGKPLEKLRVETAMARKVVSCKAKDDLNSAAQLMRQNRTRRLPVIDLKGTLVGLHRLRPALVCGCQPIELLEFLAESQWKIEHQKRS